MVMKETNENSIYRKCLCNLGAKDCQSLEIELVTSVHASEMVKLSWGAGSRPPLGHLELIVFLLLSTCFHNVAKIYPAKFIIQFNPPSKRHESHTLGFTC